MDSVLSTILSKMAWKVDWNHLRIWKEYIGLLKDKNDVEEFHWFAAHIREYSKPGQFYGRTYYYYYLDEYKYWWMDEAVEECDLINRDRVK